MSRQPEKGWPIDLGVLPPIDWDAQPLGKESDYVIAARLAVGSTTVMYQRKKRGIPPFTQYVKWENQPLGKEPDTVIAERLGLTVTAVQRARASRGIPRHVPPRLSIDWATVRFSDFNDCELAESLGIGRKIVAKARKRYGTGKRPKHHRIRAWKSERIKWGRQPLGKKSDQSIADRLGVSRGTVRDQRVRRGIPAVTGWSRQPARRSA